MKNFQIFLLLLFVSASAYAQNRTLLRGQVLYRNNFVINENVVNVTTQKATITNDNGEFAIKVKEGDELVFTAVQYQLKIVVVDQEMLKRNRLVVEVNEKVTELEEVVVGPENTEKFMKLEEEKFEKYDYERDKSTTIRNVVTSKGEFHSGINFVNIYKALFTSKKKNNPEIRLNPSEVVRQLYEDEFFVEQLAIPQEKIPDFLYFCDAKMPSNSLLKKDNEFQLLEFLVVQSKEYLQNK